MNIRLFLKFVAFLWISMGAQNSLCQALAPTNVLGFRNNPDLEASIVNVSTSICRAVSSNDGALHHYDLHLSGTVVFKNRSSRPLIVFKHPFVLAARLGTSPEEITAGRFITGIDADRVATSDKPAPVTRSDFAVVTRRDEYASDIGLTLPLFPENRVVEGTKYWVQLGIDARPELFYYEPLTRKQYAQKWRNLGQLLDLVLAKPFEISVNLNPKPPLCKE